MEPMCERDEVQGAILPIPDRSQVGLVTSARRPTAAPARSTATWTIIAQGGAIDQIDPDEHISVLLTRR